MGSFFRTREFPDIGRQDQAVDDTFLFNQGPARGLAGVRFHDYRKTFGAFDQPNVRVFRKKIANLQRMLVVGRPSKDQQRDVDFLLTLGQLFTQVIYGHLILENAKIYAIDDETIDQIFEFMVRDFSAYALQLRDKPSASRRQRWFCGKMIRRPAVDTTRFDRVWENHVITMRGVYEMNG